VELGAPARRLGEVRVIEGASAGSHDRSARLALRSLSARIDRRRRLALVVVRVSAFLSIGPGLTTCGQAYFRPLPYHPSQRNSGPGWASRPQWEPIDQQSPVN